MEKVTSIPIKDAAEHYADAFRRGKASGASEEKKKLLELLEKASVEAPFDHNVRLGLIYGVHLLKKSE